MGLEIQGAVNSMIGSARQIQEQNNDNTRKALSIALGAAGGFATGGVAGALGGAAKATARAAGVSGGDTLAEGVQGMAQGKGFIGGISTAAAAREAAAQSKVNAQSEKRDAYGMYKEMNSEQRKAFRSQIQHEAALEKRGGKK